MQSTAQGIHNACQVFIIAFAAISIPEIQTLSQRAASVTMRALFIRQQLGKR